MHVLNVGHHSPTDIWVHATSNNLKLFLAFIDRQLFNSAQGDHNYIATMVDFNYGLTFSLKIIQIVIEKKPYSGYEVAWWNV